MTRTLTNAMPLRCAKFSHDRKYLAGCFVGKAYIYNVQAGTLKCVLKNLLEYEKEDSVISVCFSHDGKYLATGTRGGVLFVWKINTKHVRNSFKGHTGSITSLDFSPNDRLLVSASTDNTVRLWNMRDGATKLLTEENPTFIDFPHYSCVVFSPDGGHVATAHRDGMVRVWCVHSGKSDRRIPGNM